MTSHQAKDSDVTSDDPTTDPQPRPSSPVQPIEVKPEASEDMRDVTNWMRRTSSASPPRPFSGLSHPTSLAQSADMFTSMFGPELMASLHLQSQYMNGHLLQHRGFPMPHLPLPNGLQSPADFMKHLQQQQQRAEQALSRSNSSAPSPHHKDNPKNSSNRHDVTPPLTTDIKTELNNSASVACGSGKVLDTAEVALKIREVLSANNIGQRLFAKHVLGLSQGTVSELLSKPKHWDKLTEKGRESYRKMHAWASSPHLVEALKAISPKKGKTLEQLSKFVNLSIFVGLYKLNASIGCHPLGMFKFPVLTMVNSIRLTPYKRY